MLADLVRTDGHHHRPVKGDSGLAEAVKVLARSHQQLVWARQRQTNMLRSALRAFYPAALAAFGGDPGGRVAVAVLGLAPSPELGRALSHPELVAALRWAGRRRQVEAPRRCLQATLASRYASARARKAYAGAAPITRASGLRQVVLARAVGNRPLSTACHLWALRR
jgi:hypothetical protein